ncbi:MAG TPA: serine/threonine-protein kinase, partial [Kofleriaceae bacterium]|nr:serine/threonine-protein kinase [Kofleriaceae bacterium]
MSLSMAIQCPCGASVEPGARFCGACGGAITAPPSPGRTVGGRYRILSKIGEGGMGAVFRAEQISLKREVALKVLRPELSADPGLVRRFNAEAEAAARLNHPNTITVYDFGQDSDGSLFIAMELISGTSLRAEVARGPIPALRTIAIAEQICASLADAHAHGVVHRDLKPDNVMISSRGREQDVVRVLDFGIAKLRDVQGDMTAMPMTQAGDLLGTPQYMAPEQIKGDKVDGRTDIYALGAMLYEMVTGQMVFVAPTLMGVLSKHLGDRPVPPAERRPDVAVPPALAEVIMAALEKPMTARPQSMDELGDRLRAVRSVLDWQGNPGPPMTPPGVYATGSLGGAPSGSVASQVPGLAPHAAAAVPSPMPVSGNVPSSVPAQAPRSRTALLIAAVVAIVLVGGAIAALAVVMSGSGGDDDNGEEPAPEPEPPAPAPQPTPPGPKHLSTDFSVEPSRNIYADDQAPDTAPHHTDPVPHHTDPVPHHTDPVPHHTDPVPHHTDPVP